MSERAPASIGHQQRRALDTAKGILMDWDGCIAIENKVLPLARQLISQHADRVAIVSNNSTGAATVAILWCLATFAVCVIWVIALARR